ncbi:hypothetical protein FJV41_10580 [Myxococcus llanfairpwllgwyngyllgogerychwyrndrobwllllantysiliogogogochensis]|uniref:Lipoprotein n=1 Tax=Myxococcus llanfairpwllgwyngyllgogerychwyrndrobwllllantysiliogogogochensis TaxID=2590453 RepID=A0A540X452_9BACT|nr:hypothetical protein FJV41_10580 [Myxococcus llanfairpwllgwyngyllgogerychwyrndrobwllllantysiliogogogochensis]
MIREPGARGAVWLAASALVLVACGSATVGSVGPPASAKWTGPAVPSPDGGHVTTSIYYGPWSCSADFMTRCERRCAAAGRLLQGCIWLADIKGDWSGRFLGLSAAAGGRLAITHCCCDYPETDGAASRRIWNNARRGFRNQWAEEFGAWPRVPGGDMWPGHHIHDLLHGGAPVARANLLPVPPEIHETINTVYPQCYAGDVRWRTIGPDRPYSD